MSKHLLPTEKGEPSLLPAAAATPRAPPSRLRRLLPVAALALTTLFLLKSSWRPFSLLPPGHGASQAHSCTQVSTHGNLRDTAYISYMLDQSPAEAQDTSVAGTGLAGSRTAQEYENLFRTIPSPKHIRESLRHYTNHTHHAGTKGDFGTVEYTAKRWAELLGTELPNNHIFDAGSPESQAAIKGTGHESPGDVRVFADTYYVWNTHPVDRYLALSEKPSDKNPAPKPFYEPSLEEDQVGDNPWSEETPAFHAYSKNGSVSYVPIVYANYGTRDDFAALAAANVSAKGAVVLVRYGRIFRGLKVRSAAEAGAVGVLIFTDTAEDGDVTEANGYNAYPDGPARQPSSLQRGSVQALSFYPGDPGTPFQPSYKNATRLDPDTADSLPKIPSLPISYRSVAPILRELQGHGLPVSKLQGPWQGTVPGVEGEYWTGPSNKTVITLSNTVTMPTDKVWNVYAVIQGYTDETVVIGNHRDAWTFGAVDPNSGSALFEETIRGYGKLLEKGWRPFRTLLVASWDAEETGLVGSTEFVEDYKDWIQDKVTSYFNVDVAVAGGAFGGRCSPSLYDLYANVSATVLDPTAPEGTNTTLDFPTGKALGSGSDFTPFLQHVGIGSAQIEFSRRRDDPVYHYHSSYDSFYWMDKFGDPTYLRHRALTELMGVVTLKALNNIFVPLNVTAYADELKNYIAQAKALDLEATTTHDRRGRADWPSLERAAQAVLISAVALDKHKERISAELAAALRVMNEVELTPLAQRRHGTLVQVHHTLLRLSHAVQKINRAATAFESNWISRAGLPERPWYRNLVVAPGRLLGYGETTLPGVVEAITLDGGQGLGREVGRLVGLFYSASAKLRQAAQMPRV